MKWTPFLSHWEEQRHLLVWVGLGWVGKGRLAIESLSGNLKRLTTGLIKTTCHYGYHSSWDGYDRSFLVLFQDETTTSPPSDKVALSSQRHRDSRQHRKRERRSQEFSLLYQPLLVVARPLHAFTPFTNAVARVACSGCTSTRNTGALSLHFFLIFFQSF